MGPVVREVVLTIALSRPPTQSWWGRGKLDRGSKRHDLNAPEKRTKRLSEVHEGFIYSEAYGYELRLLILG